MIDITSTDIKFLLSDDLKVKYKYLRGNFLRSWKKMEASGSAATDSSKEWEFLTALEFLAPHITTRISYNNMPNPEPAQNLSSSEDTNDCMTIEVDVLQDMLGMTPASELPASSASSMPVPSESSLPAPSVSPLPASSVSPSPASPGSSSPASPGSPLPDLARCSTTLVAGSSSQQNTQTTSATRPTVFSKENIQTVTTPKLSRRQYQLRLEKQRQENEAEAKERVGQLGQLLGACVEMQKGDVEERRAKEEREEKRQRLESVDSTDNDTIVQLVKPWSRLITNPVLRMEVISGITPILLAAAQKQQAMDKE